ncbi:MAG TPA: disulfide bond formation protein B [Chlamydiales bacterium]|nr:MAG: hypothetical protein A3F67_08310 [Verrucomicrobia bacterium RIFCSPHIGHO2_12_FULL_41_10]HLB53415.1 disulfide bond formation protein B [Chlamydiales bacterium]
MKKAFYFQPLSNAFFIYVLCAILGASFLHQFIKDDPPCDLCLLQRAAMLGTAISLLLNLHFEIRVEHYALALAYSLLGFFSSLYHIAIHMNPDVEIYTMPVMGQYLYVWSFWIFLSSLTSLAILLFLSGVMPKSGKLRKEWKWTAFALTSLLAIGLFITTFPD